MAFVHWLVNATAGNLIVDGAFAIPAVIAFVKLHRKLDRHHRWHVNQSEGSNA